MFQSNYKFTCPNFDRFNFYRLNFSIMHATCTAGTSHIKLCSKNAGVNVNCCDDR